MSEEQVAVAADLQTRFDEAVAKLEEIQASNADIQAQISSLADTILELDLRGTDDAGACGVAELRLRELVAERDTLKSQLEKADAAPKTTRGSKSAKARNIGPVKNQPKAADLLELIGAAETVEVAFSNGKTEVAELEPIVIAGNAWMLSLDRVKLNVPDLLVHGPGGGKPAYSVAGYGLLLDGELVAYASRSDTLAIGANSQVNLKDDIIF